MADIVKDLTNYRIKGIEKAEIEYYKQLTQTLDRIEAQIVSLVDQQLPRTAGKLIELQSAVAIRPKIKAILDKECLPFADRVVRKGFGEQAKRVERQFKTIGLIPPEFQELTKGDLALVQNLKKQYYTQFKDVSNNFTRILSDKVYQNTLVGTEFTVLEKELRESINGIYATSSDPAVNRLVDYVKNNKDNPALASRVDEAVKILQTKYASTRVGENMKRYAGQILNDSLRDFDATLNFNKAKDAGLTYVKYYGDVIPTTRLLCRNMINGVYDKSGKGIYTIAEVTRIWNSTSWSGKKSGTPMVVRGGYNCRHQFSYVNPDCSMSALNCAIIRSSSPSTSNWGISIFDFSIMPSAIVFLFLSLAIRAFSIFMFSRSLFLKSSTFLKSPSVFTNSSLSSGNSFFSLSIARCFRIVSMVACRFFSVISKSSSIAAAFLAISL